MKHIILIILLLIVKNSTAQFELDEKYTKGLNAGVFVNTVDIDFDHIYLGVRAGYQLNKHEFNLGYGVTLENTSQPVTSQYILFLNYTIYPNGINNRLNLLFDADVMFRQVFHTPYQHYGVGMGFLTNFSQRLYLKSKIGIGVETRRFIEQYGVFPNFRIGIGFRF